MSGKGEITLCSGCSKGFLNTYQRGPFRFCEECLEYYEQDTLDIFRDEVANLQEEERPAQLTLPFPEDDK